MEFEFDGEKYKQASSQQKAWGEKLIPDLGLAGDERILDLGCGDGALTARLAQFVPDGSVLGIDASRSMIETAQRDHAAANLRFELLDIVSMDFQSEFDVVFSNAALHWVKDHSKLLANVPRSLKDRGKARFQFAGEGNCLNLISVLQEAILEKRYARYFENFEWPWYMPPIQRYRTLLDEVAFTDKRLWSQNADRHFESVEAMVKWIDQSSLVPFLSHIAEKGRQLFRDAVVERMIERTKQSDGTCFETFRRINVLALK